jgi:hypothetical protein
MGGRHVPMRRCAACRAARPKAELIRVVRTVAGRVTVDPTGRAAGRGAYFCRRTECAQAAVRRDIVRRALGQSLDEQTAQQLLDCARAPEAG